MQRCHRFAGTRLSCNCCAELVPNWNMHQRNPAAFQPEQPEIFAHHDRLHVDHVARTQRLANTAFSRAVSLGSLYVAVTDSVRRRLS